MSAAAQSSFHSGAKARQCSTTLVTPAMARCTCTQRSVQPLRQSRLLYNFQAGVPEANLARRADPAAHQSNQQEEPAHLVLRLQHALDDCRALADVGEEREGEGLGILAVHVPANRDGWHVSFSSGQPQFSG